MPHIPPVNLINQVVTARIVVQRLDNCDLRLEGGQLLRLYQSDSKAWKSEQLMGQLHEYQVGKELKVLVMHRRTEDGGVYYVNERWAERSEDEVPLEIGMLVKGQVVAEVLKANNLIGYYVQLHPNEKGYKQPDARVYLPLEELPWEDGSLTERPINPSSKRLSLWIEDWVELEIIDLKSLPLFSEASLIKCIHHRDASFYYKSYYSPTTLLASNTELQAFKDKQLEQPIDGKKLLLGKRIAVLDDTEKKLQLLCQLLTKNGVEVECIQVIHGRIGIAAKSLYEKIKSTAIDLVLVDYALPQPYQGTELIDQTYKLIIEDGLSIVPDFVLISSYIEQKDIDYARKKLPFLKGFLVRPIKIDQLEQLLKHEESDNLWRTSPYYHNLAQLAQPNRAKELPELVHEIIQQGMASFIILLEVEKKQSLSWSVGIGSIPFKPDDLSYIEQHSDLKVLIRGKYTELSYSNDKNILLGIHNQKAVWQFLSISSETKYILGIGYNATNSSYHGLITQLIIQSLNDKAWRIWVDHHANFISSGVLVHSLAHEYQNYLNNLANIGHLIGLMIEHKDMNLTKLAKLGSQLKEQTQQATELIDILLQGLSHRFSPIKLVDVVRQVERLVQSSFVEGNTVLKIGQIPDITLGIPSAIITTVMVNLILNGDKHHYRNETRLVNLCISLDKSSSSSLLSIAVQDNGPGIHTRNLDRLFKIGYSSASSDEGKHGIGLWLSTELLKRVQGTIWLDENLMGLGCTFKFHVPLSLI
ncbi:MAG: HAMP domain-containing sensor histidine kinase [Thiofilum sp.]|uniref:sensor histidine kinase n=1 Tax=Thiofilum sp. TaxID=2212733 RepID=UPI0025D23EF7|nr:HAMP domain-containing sensor histidine kinase [Thiofilum sp.]MBK8454688.1 HAMP domain-containing histidine kinase [Thiofilum sp.]